LNVLSVRERTFGAPLETQLKKGGARLEPSVSSPCEWDASQLS
jgi:hypothetical protein